MQRNQNNYCDKCGAKLAENAQFCETCGAPIEPVIQQPQNNNETINFQPKQTNTNRLFYQLFVQFLIL